MDVYATRVFDKQEIVMREDPVISVDTRYLTAIQASQYDKLGFLVIKGFFDKNQINELSASASFIYENPSQALTVKEPKSSVVRSALSVHTNEPFLSVSESGELAGIAKDIVGANPYIHQSRINYKEGMQSIGWSWHSDFETWHSQDGMPRMRCVTAMIPLAKNTCANGALMVIPGSHKEYVSCPAPKGHSSAEDNFTDQKDGLPNIDAISYFTTGKSVDIFTIECDPCDLVLFDCNLLHVSNPNVTPEKRTNLFFVYNSIDNQLKRPYCGINPRPEWMGARESIKEIKV